MNVDTLPICKLSPRTALPLTVAQSHIWLGHTLSLNKGLYNIGGYIEIEGAINTAWLVEALRRNIADIENLNIVFVETAHGPAQCVLPDLTCSLPLLDLTDAPDPRAAALAWMQADVAIPFDLARGPLQRYALLRLAPDLWMFYGVTHHLVTDAFSTAMSKRRLAALYTWVAGHSGKPLLPSVAPIDLLQEDESYRVSGQEARDRDFWHTELAGRPDHCTLSGRAPVRSGEQFHASIVRPHDFAKAMARLGRAHRASFAAVLVSAVATYLSRLTGERDLVIGLPVINRPSPKLRYAFGLTANVLPLRLLVDLHMPFTALLSQVARRMRAAFRHQRYHAGSIRQDLGLLPDDPDIYGTLVNVLPIEGSCDFADATGRMFHLRNWRADDLLITAFPAADARPLEIVFSANAANYTADRLARHLAAFEHLLADIVEAPDKPGGRLRLMADEDRGRLLRFDRLAPPPATLPALFETQVARRPDAPAVLWGIHCLSYRTLDLYSTQMAQRLRNEGIGSGHLVGLCISRRPESIAGLLAIMKAGAVFVPLDLTMPQARLCHILDEARPALVLGHACDSARLTQGVPFLVLPPIDVGRRMPGDNAAAIEWRSQPVASDLAYVIFTSGSSGQPKGVMVTHQGIAALAASHVERFAVGPESRVLQYASLAFDASVAELATAWGSGAALVLAPPESLSGPALQLLVETAQVTHATLPPAVLATLTPRKLPLVCLAVAGESCSPQLVASWSCLTRMVNAYGPTEATVCVSLSDDLGGDGVPIGRPIVGSRIYVLDTSLEPTPEGIEGDIYIAGDSLASGYLNQPGETAARFVADPFGPSGSRMYSSGDRGFWRPDGQLEFLGRADRQVKIRGIRVEPAEIEAVLKSLPEVADAVVVARPDRLAKTSLAAYLVLAPGTVLDAFSVRGRLTVALPAYMLPTVFVALPALPLNASGKLDRRSLPTPEREMLASATYALPEGERETEIVSIWQGLLGLARVGRHDNFFALGGHSLLLIALAARLRERGWAVDFAPLFNDLTPATLAASVINLPNANEVEGVALPHEIAPATVENRLGMVPSIALDQPSIDRIVAAVPGGAGNIRDIYPLSPLQEGMLFRYRTALGRDVYILSVQFTLADRARLDRFVESLRTVIARHDCLRTALLWEGLEEPVQVVWRTASLPIKTCIPAQGDVRESLWQEVEAAAHIDLRHAPLLRLRLAWDAARGEWCVLLQFHHAVTDHLTLEWIVAEMRTLLSDRADGLLPETSSRGTFVLAQPMEFHERHVAFFRGKLGDIDSPTAPFDLRGMEGQDGDIEEARLVVAAELAEAIRDQAGHARVSCAVLFHAVWALVLARLTGRRDIVFGTVLSGRLQSRVGAPVALGLAINTLPLRLSLNRLTLAGLIREVQASIAELLAHEQASLALAQSCSGVSPPTPLFTTLLNYRHSQPWTAMDADGALQFAEGIRLLRWQELSHYPFTVTIDDLGRGFNLTMQAPRRIGAAALAGTFLAALSNFSEALADTPGLTWDGLEVTADTALHPVGSKMILPYPGASSQPAGKKDGPICGVTLCNGPTSNVAPFPPTRVRLASIWCNVLRVSHVGPNDDFFALGGHSLSALRVMTQLRESFGLDMPVKTLFASRTLEALAARIEEHMQDGSAAPTSLPIEPCEAEGQAPLSHSQERIWLIQSLAPNNTAYNMPIGLMFTGRLDLTAFAKAVSLTCDRHELLRSVIRTVDGLPAQRVVFETGTKLDIVDLRDLGANAERSARVLAEKLVRKPFDLGQDRPVRVTLYRLEDARSLVAVVVHHVMADHWSMGIIGRTLAAFYNAELRGLPPQLDTLRISYRDFAIWQRAQNAGSANRLDYWHKQLADLPTLDLPTDRPHPALPSLQGGICLLPFPLALAARIEALGGKTGATLFMVMLSALATLLHRLSGQADIPIAVPVANRAQSATETLVGTFVNTLVIRADMSAKPNFESLVRRIRATVLDALAHQDVPFDLLVSKIVQRRNANRAPLAQVMFNVANTPIHGVAFDEVEWQPVIFDRGGSQFDLSVTVDLEVSQTVSFEYSSDVFDRFTVERIAAAYFTLLDAACADAQSPIHKLSLVPEKDLTQLRAWNDTIVRFPPEATCPVLFRAQALRSPWALAVSWQGETLSYAELDARSDALARHLRALGAGLGSLVALCVPRTLALPVALLGILKSGAAYVPLDPDYPPDRLSFMLADSGATLLLTTDGCASDIDPPPAVRIVDLSDVDNDALAKPGDGLAPIVAHEDPAYVIYTSGSTGRPKGVVIPHGALANFLLSMQRRPGLAKDDILASVSTISFDIAALEIFLPLCVGAAVEIVPRATASDGVALAKLLAVSKATVMQATPATWRLLLEAGWQGGPGFRAFCGGETLPRGLADTLLGRVAELWNLYGPTETTIWSTLDRVSPGHSITIGQPIDNTRVRIVDDNGEALPIGFSGEICIGGAGVALGYLNRPELTEERFVTDPHFEASAARLYRTGDLGKWNDEGKLLHLGRRDHQVKLRGFRVEIGEIESVLATHPAVRQVVVVLQAAESDDPRLVAYVVYQDGEDLTASEVRRYLRHYLPDYMVPPIVMRLELIPLTLNGKVDRRALPNPFESSRRVLARSELPTTPEELVLAGIWCSILGVKEVFAEDNFFELGGHSLLALRASVAMKKQTGIQLDPRALFFHSLRQLASMVATEAAGEDALR